jgi:hypothetical protein
MWIAENKEEFMKRRPAKQLFYGFAMLLLASCIETQVVRAAPPELSASANPVMVAASATSANVTISWNTGTDARGRVWLSVDGAAETQFDPPAGNDPARKGSRVQSVVPGSTYVFRLWNKDKSKLWRELEVKALREIFPTVGSGVKLQKPDLVLPIEINFPIGNANVEPHGTFADLSFTTADAAVPMILVSTQAPNAFKRRTPKGEKAPPAFNKGDVVSTAFPLLAGKQTSHKVRLTNLQPGTSYHFVIEAMSADGATLRHSGTFTTLRRFVTVKFTQLHVHNDSDYWSDGDLAFGFSLNGQHNFDGNDLVYSDSIASGKSRNLNLTATVADAPDELHIKILCADDDKTEIFPSLDKGGLGGKFDPNGWSNEGDTSDWEWQQVEGKYILPDESETKPIAFELHAKGDDLEYRIRGTYQVQYLGATPKIITPMKLEKKNNKQNLPILERVKPKQK